ncbi:HK97 gp10 family phage protein [Levilactobacillus bambusae]|uniref:HK97 gp10 family phage protein n=1 Tax=Levilactobacillus bambusae TaxID=2024736 RepID=A0A2V1N372_9LACO|nr:HK97 gp10 family phage protein [Levilactobacillus bambusae]PWG00958.1 hypothetical protein DCM90_01920 [Levilactobacillus bambusae]
MPEIKVEGLDRLMRKLELLPDELDDALWDANFDVVEEADQIVVRELQSSMKHSTGELAGSLHYEVVKDEDGHIRGRLFSNDPVATYREFGTGLVGQASEKVLPDGINPVYTQHPWFIPVNAVDSDLNAIYGMPIIKINGKKYYRTNGQPARQFMTPAIQEAGKEAPEIIKDRVHKKLGELTDGL